MGYYDDEFYKYNDSVITVSLITEDFSESVLTEVLWAAGLVSEKRPQYVGTMEKLVFMYGEDSEVYSPMEIRFIERIEEVFVYPDYIKTLNKGSMVCRTIAAKIDCRGHDALRTCVSFEKIINKALDGFNIFFFITEDSVFFGCRLFDKTGKRDCALSNPIKDEIKFEQIVEELSYLTEAEAFMDYYSHFQQIITFDQRESEDYEDMIMRRIGIQLSYLEEIEELGRDIGLDMSREKERYRELFDDEPEVPFSSLLEEVDESLSFIKSNRVNTYELLFEANEMISQAEKVEAENYRHVRAEKQEHREDYALDEEAKRLLENPEVIIKLLKKRRGL